MNIEKEAGMSGFDRLNEIAEWLRGYADGLQSSELYADHLLIHKARKRIAELEQRPERGVSMSDAEKAMDIAALLAELDQAMDRIAELEARNIHLQRSLSAALSREREAKYDWSKAAIEWKKKQVAYTQRIAELEQALAIGGGDEQN